MCSEVEIVGTIVLIRWFEEEWGGFDIVFFVFFMVCSTWGVVFLRCS